MFRDYVTFQARRERAAVAVTYREVVGEACGNGVAVGCRHGRGQQEAFRLLPDWTHGKGLTE